MLASELIARLTKGIELHGDLTVAAPERGGCCGFNDYEAVDEVNPGKVDVWRNSRWESVPAFLISG